MEWVGGKLNTPHCLEVTRAMPWTHLSARAFEPPAFARSHPSATRTCGPSGEGVSRDPGVALELTACSPRSWQWVVKLPSIVRKKARAG